MSLGHFGLSFLFLGKEDVLMLVLGRKPGEYVMIGKEIMVKVVKSDEGDLRLAIQAPKSIGIVRGELYEKQVNLLQFNS